MKAKELKRLLAEVPDDAEVLLWLSHENAGPIVERLRADYYCDQKLSEPGQAQTVALIEEPDDSDNLRGFSESVRLGLPAEFVDLCAEHEVEADQVLHGFIADVCGLCNYGAAPRADRLGSKGADERMLAQQYFNRCGYGMGRG